MAGYKWDPLFRIEPRNGRAYYVAVLTAFTDAGGHVKADVRYTPDRPERVTASRGLADARFGWRPEVDLDFQILTMSDQHALAQIADGLMSDGYNVQLSMDGGVTMREVVLSKPVAPKALAGKTFAGAAFELGVKCVELIDAIPRMGETTGNEIGAREHLSDGGMEQWVSASNLQAWSENAGGVGTFTQNTADAYAGTYCVAITKSGTGTAGLSQYTPIQLLPGRWYQNYVYNKATARFSNGARLYLRRHALVSPYADFEYLTTSGTWSTASQYHTVDYSELTWTVHGQTFRVDDSFNDTDGYYQSIDYGSASGVGETNYFDAATLYGPVLPTGVSLW